MGTPKGSTYMMSIERVLNVSNIFFVMGRSINVTPSPKDKKKERKKERKKKPLITPIN
jgi:hypothetical protein